ncbi:MAG TPA: TetR/AcrR family transcriptional regulator [Bryobacteraceae bacterium]|nr:TetR/AcrR family transcriptional regulator [Bryobacteraceae bacterium]HPQ14784.1 TetR/AcrR family transcriptional regulator [Bryobacteraceae bacterium]
MPLPDQSVRDPRIRRTRKLLQDALRTLLRQKPLDEILVHEITDEATVNRATFYDHYRDKLDLFNALIAADFEKLLEQRNVRLDRTCSSGLAAIALAVGDYLQHLHRDQAACTRQASSGPFVDAAVTLAIQRIVLDGLKKQARRASAPDEVIAAMVSGAIYGAVKELLSRTDWRVDEAALASLANIIHPLLEQKSAAVHAPASAPRTSKSTKSARRR